MKRIIIVYTIILISGILFNACNRNNDSQTENKSEFSELKGPYLGQEPPGDVPELFAPGIVSTVYWEHSGAVFTPDGNELFWSREINEGRRRTPRIIVVLHMKQENGVWTRPKLALFNFHDADTYNHINSVSPDGKRLYFYTTSEEKGSRAWVVDKTEHGWSECRLLRLNTIDNPGSIASEVHETRNGNLFFEGILDKEPQRWGIFSSRFVGGKYQEYESLGPHVNFQVNDSYPNFHPTVDPDERFVIFVSRRPGGFGDQDLYISFFQPDDTWGPAINLGPKINTIGAGNSWPQLSPDGKYLFFTSRIKPYDENDIHEKKYSYADLMDIRESIRNGLGNIYWVSTSFVDQLMPDHLKKGLQE